MSSGLQPHPLIVGLATRLVREKKPGATKSDLRALVSEVRGGRIQDKEEAANEFASTPQLPELAIFIGFLGGTIKRDEKTWRLLYQDPKALTWLLVEDDEIVWWDTVEDKSSPSGRRDVLWVKKESTVAGGVGPESAEGQFLRGKFTSAGDLHASMVDASPAPADSGILCVPTPDCYCSPYRTR